MSNKHTSEAAGLRVLIVDDDPIFQALASARLAADGHHTRVATDGVDALELLEVEQFDIALIDLSMPRIDGFRLIALIRGAPRLRRLAIMVVTVRLDREARDEALALGANAVVTKPVQWDNLAAFIRPTVEMVQRQHA